MPIFLVFGCEVVALSFLIGAFMSSVVFGFTLCGLSSLTMYFFYQKFYKPFPFVWGVTLLAGMNSLLWASYIDKWCGTTYVAVLLGFITAVCFYFLNKRFFKKSQR